MKIILVLFILALYTGCDNSSYFLTKANANYHEYKHAFPHTLIEHFPQSIRYVNNGIIYSTNTKKNDIGLVLYLQNVKESDLDSLEVYTKRKSVASYKSTNECLLIVNRFETQESYDSYEPVKLDSSVKVERDCFSNMYPIPNFNRYNYSGLDFKVNNFEIYVLDAKRGIYWDKVNLRPDYQMPAGWKNGYSRGIAIDKKEKKVLFWLVIW